jgi:hypothetical protein
LQVCCRKTFGEAVVNRSQQFARFGDAALTLPDPRETRRRSQLPEESILAVRQVEGAPEMLFGDNGGIRRARQKDQFTPDAEQLCDIPAFVAGLASGERILDNCQSRCDLTSLTETLRQFAQQEQKSRQKPCIARLFEPAAQRLEAGAEIVALRDHQTVEAASPDVPQTYRVTLGMFEQHRSIALGGIEIACPEGYRARPLTQDAAKGQGLPDGVPFLDIPVDYPQRLFGKSLKPQDARLKIMRRYSHIEPHTDDLRLHRQSCKLIERPVDMIARLSLIAEVVLGRG